MRFLQRALASPRLWLVLPLLAMALASPSLGSGFQTEDYILREASRATEGWFDNLFGRTGDVTWDNYGAKDFGALPWITPHDWRVAFWRPLTSFLHHIEFRTIPDRSDLMHLQSLVWLGLLVACVMLAQRRFLASEAPWVAGLAALLYAIDDGHGFAVGWLANRSALVAAALGVSALIFHDRFRSEARLVDGILSALLLSLALLAAESALGITGFFVAHALFLERGRLGRRLRGALPWLSVAVAWSIAYRAQGYGAQGSGAYIDPLTQPLDFAQAVGERVPVLLFGLFGAAPIDLLALLDPAFLPWLLALAWGFLLVVALLVFPLVRARTSARFWAAGTLLSLVPACTAFPAERMLFIPGLGASALVGLFIAEIVSGAKLWQGARRQAALALAGLWVLVHGLGAALLLPLRSLGLAHYSAWVDQTAERAFRGVVPDQQLIIVNALDYYTGSMMLSMRAARGEPVPAHTRIVHGGQDAVTLTRQDAHTLLVRPADGFLGKVTNAVYRSPSRPMRAGDGFQLTGLQIVITEVDEGGMPLEAAFRFGLPLESPKLRFVAWDGETYRVLALPPIGGRSVVGPAPVDPFEIWL